MDFLSGIDAFTEVDDMRLDNDTIFMLLTVLLIVLIILDCFLIYLHIVFESAPRRKTINVKPASDEKPVNRVSIKRKKPDNPQEPLEV